MAEERSSFATLQDVIDLTGPIPEDQEEQAENLLPVISDRLRYEAEKVGRDLDRMIERSPALSNVAKSVTADILRRTLSASAASAGSSFGPMTQMTQTAGPYSLTGTLLNPGGSLFVKKSELSALGLRRQRYGVIDLYDCGDNDNTVPEE